MRIKEGVKINGMRQETTLALVIASQVYADVAGAELVVTEITGGKHGTASLHYVGLAADLRTGNIAGKEAAVVAELKKRLGENYDVVLESTHIHIEFQPK